jgi:hypothetical protein
MLQRWFTGWMIGGSRPVRGWEFFSSPLHPDRLWGPPSHLSNGTVSLGIKWPGREADHSPPSSAELEVWVELFLHSPNMPSWRRAQVNAQNHSVGKTVSRRTVSDAYKYFSLLTSEHMCQCQDNKWAYQSYFIVHMYTFAILKIWSM